MDLAVKQALDADEMFLTNSQFGLLAVERCEGLGEARCWSGHSMSARAAALLAETGIVECRS